MNKLTRTVLITVSLLSCVPLGIAVWYYSFKTKKLIIDKDIVFAEYYYNLTKQLTLLSVILGGVAFYFIFFWLLPGI